MNPYTLFEMANAYANDSSGCIKVRVGSVIVVRGGVYIFGANRAIPNLCKYKGCLRIEKYGEQSKAHRNPEDCRAIHSEIDAITKAARLGISLGGSRIYITRYPCEACARAIISAGIKHVWYGRKTKVSKETQAMFEAYGVECYNYSQWDEEDDNT